VPLGSGARLEDPLFDGGYYPDDLLSNLIRAKPEVSGDGHNDIRAAAGIGIVQGAFIIVIIGTVRKV
jgi:hypothetical protein